MNIAEKITSEVNKINRKVDILNEKIAPMPIRKLPVIKPPSRKSQKISASVTGLISVSTLLLGSTLLKSKTLFVAGLIGITCAGISYMDAKSDIWK